MSYIRAHCVFRRHTNPPTNYNTGPGLRTTTTVLETPSVPYGHVITYVYTWEDAFNCSGKVRSTKRDNPRHGPGSAHRRY